MFSDNLDWFIKVLSSVPRQGKVPDMLFSTTELPPDISINGKGCLLQGRYVMCCNESDFGILLHDI